MSYYGRVVPLALAAAMGGAPAQGRDLSAPASDLAVAFVVLDGAAPAPSSGDALLDTGRVSGSSRGGRRPRAEGRSAIVERRVAVRVTSRSGRAGFVRLSASLESADPRVEVTLDGVALTPAPRLVDPHAPIGFALTHVVRIKVSPSEPPGAFASRIVWDVEES